MIRFPHRSGASTRFGAAPNTQASAVDLAVPGTLTGESETADKQTDAIQRIELFLSGGMDGDGANCIERCHEHTQEQCGIFFSCVSP